MKKISILLKIFLLICVCCTGCKSDARQEDNTIDETLLVTEQNSVVSPSGEYILEIYKSHDGSVTGFHIKVSSFQEGKEVFRSEEFFAFRHVNFLTWGENDAFWIYSGDLGVFYWEKTDTSWVKKGYIENKGEIDAPDILKKLRPRSFQ